MVLCSNSPTPRARKGGRTRSSGTFHATNGGGYDSPKGDAGALTNDGGGGYLYTAVTGEVSHFNSSGIQTSWVSADGLSTISLAAKLFAAQ